MGWTGPPPSKAREETKQACLGERPGPGVGEGGGESEDSEGEV